ncbi:MAG: hypothetical protein H6581_16950 [Bacteroidia bacterium]|nr:hypothetical protein [Bacteroidia bacterium]
MNEAIKSILPGQGLGSIKFGISRDELKKILGEPDEKDAYETEGIKTEDWHYDEIEASFSFDEEDDWRLCVISVNAEYYEFKGKSLLGEDFDEVLAFLEECGMDDLEVEDHSSDESPDHKLISSEDDMINFWFDEGILQEIQWGPRFEDDESIIWPS